MLWMWGGELEQVHPSQLPVQAAQSLPHPAAAEVERQREILGPLASKAVKGCSALRGSCVAMPILLSLTWFIPGKGYTKENMSTATGLPSVSVGMFTWGQSYCAPRSSGRKEAERVGSVCILKGWLISIWNRLFQY